MIATKHDLVALLADAASHDAALAHLQCLMDERYQYDSAGTWGVVEPNGLTRLGVAAAEAVAMGAVDRVIAEPQYSGPTLAETVAARTTAAAAACSAVLAPLRARFAAGEELTWQAQLVEANALLSNPALAVVPEPGTEEARTWVDPIPTIRGIVAVTGEDIGAFSEAVRRNNETWTAVTTYCIGQRQRFVATIKAVAAAEGATVADVLAVPLEIALPG